MKKICLLLAGTLAFGLAACSKNDDEQPSVSDFPTTTLTPTTTTIRVADLPAPYASQSATNYPQVLSERPANATLQVPQGYAVNICREGLPMGCWMAVAPNGDVFVAQMSMNQISVLRDTNQDGKADQVTVWGTGGMLDRAMGMAFLGNYFYVACSGALLRLHQRPNPGRGHAHQASRPTLWQPAPSALTAHSQQ